MKKQYLIGGIVAVLIAVALFFGLQSRNVPVEAGQLPSVSTEEGAAEPEALHVYADGVLVYGGQLLKEDTWYVGLEHEGRHLAVELIFDENSLCIGRSASGTCLPDIFIEDRPVHVEGVVDGDAMRVQELTFTQALQ